MTRLEGGQLTRCNATSTAYEMDDLKAVAIFQCGSLPLLAANDFAVELYGHAVGLHAKFFYERQESKG